MFVEIFSNRREAMSTINFSVPDEVKNEFNCVFGGRNKSAILVDLMREAIAREKAKARRSAAIDRILARRARTRPVTPAEIRRARKAGRP
jgi:hypothetical protein